MDAGCIGAAQAGAEISRVGDAVENRRVPAARRPGRSIRASAPGCRARDRPGGRGCVPHADGYDSGILTAALTEGAVIEGDGALIGASIGSDAAVLGASTTGTYTAGKAKVILTYIPVDGDAA